MLHPVLIDSDQINAFAAPGGIIGINLGLYLAAQDVHEYSSVIAHEIAHLSQRHFARGLEAQRAQSIPALLGMLTGALIVAAGGGEAGLAAVTAAQALAQGQALRYSRGREKEADRVGLSTLARTNMDPYGMSRMFERMQRAYRFTERPPEFLLTHPITESRIADALNQAAKYPRQEYANSLEYLYMRARAVVHYAKTAQQAIRDARTRIEKADSSDNRYLLALALSRGEKHEQAVNQMRLLYENNDNSILLTFSYAEILISANRLEEANQILEKSLRLNPSNAPLSMLLAQSLQQEGDFSEAGHQGSAALAGTLGQDLADSNQPSALRPWHARSFMDSAVQRLSVALQRTIQRDQVLRPHLRRVQRGGVPADYFECGGDAGYRRSSSLRSSGDGGSSRTRGHRGVSSP